MIEFCWCRRRVRPRYWVRPRHGGWAVPWKRPSLRSAG